MFNNCKFKIKEKMQENTNREEILVTALIKSNLHFPVYFDTEDIHIV